MSAFGCHFGGITPTGPNFWPIVFGPDSWQSYVVLPYQRRTIMDISKPGRLVWYIHHGIAGYRWLDKASGELFEPRKISYSNSSARYTVTDWHDQNITIAESECENLHG